LLIVAYKQAKVAFDRFSKLPGIVESAKQDGEFNEIFDLTAMRVIVGSVKDCYGAIGVIH